MTTVVNDVSNKCLASVPVVMSDGGPDPRKTSEIGQKDELLAQRNLKRHCKTTVCRDVCRVPKLYRVREPLVLVASIPCIPEVVVLEVAYLSILRILWMSSFSSCFLAEGQEHLVFAVNRSLEAAGDVVGNRRWWRDV